MEQLAIGLAEEMVSLGLNSDEQTIANYIADNSDFEGTLYYTVAKMGRSLTETIMDDFISDVQFYMEELREVEND